MAKAKKNPAAVALARLRAKSLTPKRRTDIARQGGKARMAKLTKAQRHKAAQRAAKARWSVKLRWGAK
jgi:hypothetical protein